MAGTDGGANEEATGQFDSRAICSKYKPTFADTYSINQYMALKSTIPDALHICFIHGVATNRGAWGFDFKARIQLLFQRNPGFDLKSLLLKANLLRQKPRINSLFSSENFCEIMSLPSLRAKL